MLYDIHTHIIQTCICYGMLFFSFFSSDVAKLNIIYIKLHFNEIDQLIRFKTAKQ